MKKQICHREHRGHRESAVDLTGYAFAKNGFVFDESEKWLCINVRRNYRTSAETFSVNSVFSVAKKGFEL
ncbi:MAG: hypothetical protein PHQ60_08950 [Sideroxydans sp.]|nr:hypothetical protein [Sideroxydans sp.]